MHIALSDYDENELFMDTHTLLVCTNSAGKYFVYIRDKKEYHFFSSFGF